MLGGLQLRRKQICVLEMLWPILASVVWGYRFQDAYVTVFEDNTGAERGLLKGMSMHTDINVLIALFWGAAAHHHTKHWVEYIRSHDNPADCLTKPGLDASHLSHAKDVTHSIDWDAVFRVICGAPATQLATLG